MTKGVLSGWHNLSTNGALNVSGVSVQDILSILNTIKTDPRFITWKEMLDDMYTHVVNQNNPHHVTTDQLATTVIQLIYEAWLLEGYSGELQYFIDLLYRYIEFADDTIMNEGVSEIHVPTVDVLTRYIERHNTDPNAHDDRINPYFLGNCEINDPTFACRQLVGLTDTEISRLNVSSEFYENVPIQENWVVDEFTFVLSFKFVERTIFQYQNANSSVVLRITSQPSQSRILFTRCIANNPNGVYNVPITADVNTLQGFAIDHVAIPNDKAVAKCVLMSRGSVVTFGLYVRSADTSFDVDPQIIDVDLNGTPSQIVLPTKPKPISSPKISFTRMNSGDPLTDLIYYPQHLTIENLLYVYEWLDGNTRELPVILDPEDPDNPEIIIQPNDPTEPSTAPIVFLTAGDIGTFKVSSTAELWRPITFSTLENIVSIVKKDEYVYAATKDGNIYRWDETEWVFVTNLTNIKINKFWYSDGYFVIVGTYDIYLPENNGVIVIASDLNEWFITWEDWGPALNDCHCGSYISSYAKDLLFVFVGDEGRVGYIEAEYISDFPYGTVIPVGPNGVCDLKCVTYGNNIYIAAGTGAMVTRSVGNAYGWTTPIQVGSDPSIVWRHIEFLNPEFLLMGDGGYISKSIDGINWSTPIQINPLSNPVLCSWYDAVYDFDTVALVGNSGRVTRSTDYMESWAPVKQISEHPMNSVISKRQRDIEKDMLYAVDGQARVLTSYDMINWTPRDMLFNIEWYHILYGNGVFVACGSKGFVSHSTDGENWSIPLSITDSGFQIAEFINGTFYLLSNEGAFYTSTNGVDWTYLRTLSLYSTIGYVFQGLSADNTGKFVLAAGNYYFRSIDGGLTWSKITFSSGYWMSAAYGNGKWVLVGMAGRVSSSVDAINWTAPTQPLGILIFNDVAFGNGIFVAVTSTNKVAYSTNGVNWSYTTVGLGSWNLITFNGDRFIITNGTQISESLDGIVWSNPTDIPGTLTDCIYVNNYYYTIRKNGDVLKGLTLASLTQRSKVEMLLSFKKIVFGYTDYDWYRSSYALALADGGLFSYLDGYYGWTSVYSSYPHNWVAGTFAGSFWTLVSMDGAVVSSYNEQGWDWSYEPDIFPGIIWRDVKGYQETVVVAGHDGMVLCFMDPRAVGTPVQVFTKNWIRVLHDGTQFVLLSEDGFITTSPDGIEWSLLTDTGVDNAKDMCHGNGLYMVLDEVGRVTQSDDLVTWTAPTKIGTELWDGILYAKYKYILYSSNSILSVSDTGKKWREYLTTSPIDFMDIDVGPLIVVPAVSGGETPN